jgi:hypothetical protein
VKNRRRHIFSAIFGAILLLPVLAIGFLQIGQAYIKSTREERLTKEGLVKVILPASKVVWEEEEKELWVGDKMFDVASYEIIDGQYHLNGVFDNDETEIAGSLLHLLFSGKSIYFLQLLLLLQCFSVSIILIQIASHQVIRPFRFPAHVIHPCWLPKLVLAPPPRQ